jgi:hypothetical protein
MSFSSSTAWSQSAFRGEQLAKEEPKVSSSKFEYRRPDRSLNLYKEKGEKMKRIIFAAAVLATLLCVQNANAFPGERMPYRAAHFAQRVAYNIDNHVIHPVTHGMARRLR